MIETADGSTVYEVQLPEGKHYCPKYVKNVRNAGDNHNGAPLIQSRIVRCHPMGFEGDGGGKRKYLAPIVWAHLQGNMIVCAVALEGPGGTNIARTFMTPEQYYASPVGEVESL